MAVGVSIDGITGVTPFHIYICQSDGTGCIFIDSIYSYRYGFTIPSPYDLSTSYMLKVVDGNGLIMTGVTSVL